MNSHGHEVDIFGEFRQRYTIPDVWQLLGVSGDPKPSCCCPWREEKNPSFSIYEDGRKFKDHAGDTQGDVIEFVRHSAGLDYKETRRWCAEQLGIDLKSGSRPIEPIKIRKREPRKETPKPPKEIEWPCDELLEGDQKVWNWFMRKRQYSRPGVWAMVKAGFLRFARVHGHKAFVVTDETQKCAEIRRLDGKRWFEEGPKAYPLSGVDKSWPLGFSMHSTERQFLAIEGSTDFLSAVDLFAIHRKRVREAPWLPIGILGASVREFAPEFLGALEGAHVRICADPDDDGEIACFEWGRRFRDAGATVDLVALPPGKDLSDAREEVTPEDLFKAA